MGVRPPTGDSGEHEVLEFGIPALADRLDSLDVSFPTDANAVAHRAGHVEVPYDGAGHTVTLAEALEETDESQFETRRELLNALHPVFERKRAAASGGLLGTIRSMLPI